MATFTFVKKSGAPAGTINFQIGNDNWLIDDSANLTIVTTDPLRAGDLNRQPFLTLQGVTGTVTPPPTLEQILLVNGVLSKPAGDGTYTTVSAGGTVTITSPGSTVTVGGSSSAPTVDINKAALPYMPANTARLGSNILRSYVGLWAENSRSFPFLVRPAEPNRRRCVLRCIGANPITVQFGTNANGNFNAPSYTGALVINQGQEWVTEGSSAPIFMAPGADGTLIRATVYTELGEL